MIATALANHLWQSTVFAVIAGLLTVALRRNHAGVRYWLWFVASLKFLIPFSVLAGVGGRLAGLFDPAPGLRTRLHFAIDVVAGAVPAPRVPGLALLFPVLLGLWLCGSLTVLILRCLQWQKAAVAARSAVPLCHGRELETLRQIEPLFGIQRRIEILQSRASLEPGIFGIVRPVLLWPEGISDRLDDAQLRAVLVHELQHVRRYDNLAAAAHMVVEAIFWFHPLVWWLGNQMVRERERACDDDVLQFGSQRGVYAASILKVCEFCVASPLPCLSGVAGNDLNKRMVYIMTDQKLRKLDFSRKLLLAAAGFAAIAGPIASGLTNPMPTWAASRAEAVAALQSDAPTRVHVAPGVMQGLLIKKVNPIYPEDAKNARIQGVVVLTAIINKDGEIENLQIVSGHPKLAPAAIEAVKQWQYKPYLLNGQPVEVKTEIHVNFTLAAE